MELPAVDILSRTSEKIVIGLKFPDLEGVTVDDYWSCECDIIRPKTIKKCDDCRFRHFECSDARIGDVILWLIEKYAKLKV